MDQIKKLVREFDSKIAFFVVAGLCALAFIFFLALPSLGVGPMGFKGFKLLDSTPFPLFMMSLACLLGPIALAAITYFKQRVNFLLCCVLFVCTLFVGTYMGKGFMGVAVMINMIIYLLLGCFAFFREDAPVKMN